MIYEFWSFRKVVGVFALIFASLSSVGCSQKNGVGSTVVVQMPSAGDLNAASGKVSALAYEWPKACFLINVSASDIALKRPNACSVPAGISVGWAAEGGKLMVEVPRGEKRKLEVFAHFRSSTSEQCPASSVKLDQMNPTKIVRIGETTFNVDLPEVVVAVEVSLPAAGTNAATQYGLAASCAATATSTAGSARIVPGRAVSSSSSYRIDGVISASAGTKVLSSSNMKMELSRKAE